MSTVLPAEGDELPPFEVTPTIEDAVRFCGLAWTFPPVFFDQELARAQGMPGPIVPGPVKLGQLYRAMDHWLAGRGFVREVRAANRQPDRAGRPLTIVGTVSRRYEEEGRQLADIEALVIGAEGHPSVRAHVVVEFFAS